MNTATRALAAVLLTGSVIGGTMAAAPTASASCYEQYIALGWPPESAAFHCGDGSTGVSVTPTTKPPRTTPSGKSTTEELISNVIDVVRVAIFPLAILSWVIWFNNRRKESQNAQAASAPQPVQPEPVNPALEQWNAAVQQAEENGGGTIHVALDGDEAKVSYHAPGSPVDQRFGGQPNTQPRVDFPEDDPDPWASVGR